MSNQDHLGCTVRPVFTNKRRADPLLAARLRAAAKSAPREDRRLTVADIDTIVAETRLPLSRRRRTQLLQDLTMIAAAVRFRNTYERRAPAELRDRLRRIHATATQLLTLCSHDHVLKEIQVQARVQDGDAANRSSVDAASFIADLESSPWRAAVAELREGVDALGWLAELAAKRVAGGVMAREKAARRRPDYLTIDLVEQLATAFERAFAGSARSWKSNPSNVRPDVRVDGPALRFIVAASRVIGQPLTKGAVHKRLEARSAAKRRSGG